MENMFRIARSGLAAAAAAVLLAAAQPAAAAPFLGEEIETLSQFGGPPETRTETVASPGIEIQFSDANAFSWMLAGDYIEFTHNAIVINLDGAHSLTDVNDLHFEFRLTTGNFWDIGAMAIVKAINVNLISGSVAGDTFTLDIFDPENAHEFGGLVEIRINNITDVGGEGPVPVPAPAALPLLAAGLLGIGALRRRPARHSA